LKTKDLTSN